MSLAFTVTNIIVRGSSLGGRKLRLVKIVGDNAYPAGGYAVTAANCNFDNGLDALVPLGVFGAEGAAGTGLVPQWDRTNSKLKLWKGNGAAALTESGAGDPDTLVGQFLAIGY